MDEANRLLKQIDPSISGLASTILQAYNKVGTPSGKFIQFVHADDSHWITVSNLLAAKSDTVIVTAER
jgi:hypothetical protein